MSSFDRIAPVYDFLARLIFGKGIVKAQEYYLSAIKEHDRILILGGGTGWILDSIFRVTSPGEIWYIDHSSKMIARARERMPDSGNIHFITGTEDQIPQGVKFDVVITNFFLDMFPAEKMPTLIAKILSCTSPDCTWLCSDFVDTGKWFHQLLLRAMYLFFRLVASLDNRALPNWEDCLLRNGMSKAREKIFWNGFIKSVVFTK